MTGKTHVITLSVQVEGPERWDSVWHIMSKMAKTFGTTNNSVNVSSTLIDIPLSGETVHRVRAALREAGLNEIQIDASLQCMDDFGITYKEME